MALITSLIRSCHIRTKGDSLNCNPYGTISEAPAVICHEYQAPVDSHLFKKMHYLDRH